MVREVNKRKTKFKNEPDLAGGCGAKNPENRFHSASPWERKLALAQNVAHCSILSPSLWIT